jgi:acyl-CoA reductase-like NAD-dependent aldehyde dehydrogenase
VTALLAGNTVILKPSSVTPDVSNLMNELCKNAGLPPDVVQVIIAGSEAGTQLIKARPDKIFFTGSVATGRKIMEMAAENLIPLALELGGKDPMIVFEDADMERAVEGAVYGAFAGSGQLCVSIERLYVQDSIYEEFASRVAERVNRLRVGSGVDCDLGPMTTSSQIEIIETQLRDALAKGATLLSEVRKEGNLCYPVVIRDATHDMKLMQEETFGPVLPIMPFGSEEEAITLANDSSFGLNASVWSGDREKATRVARRLETGNVYINDVVKNIGNPTLPFGGVKQSGFGKYHGPEGLHSFSIETSVMVNKNKGKREVNWFPFDQELVENLKKLLRLLYEEIPWFEKIRIFLSMRSLVKKG